MTKTTGFCLSLLLLALSTTMALAEPPYYRGELIFPPERWHNHSSSIVQAPNGDLIVCWYHGSGERKADDVLVLGSRRKAGAREWEEPFVMADVPGFPDCNPTLFIDQQGRLWLFWVSIYSNEWGSALLKYRFSSNYQDRPGPPEWDWQDVIMLKPLNFAEKVKREAERFRALLEAYPGVQEEVEAGMKLLENKLARRMGWMTRTHPITLPSGRILVPLYTDVFSVSLMAISDDSGRTWYASEPLVGPGAVQPSVVRRSDGTLAAYMRDNGPRQRIQYSESKDDGVHWGPVQYLDIPNPGSSVEVIALQSGRWILVANDTERGRHSLMAMLSEDEGRTWRWSRHLERVPPGRRGFSYPSVIQARDGRIHVTYSYTAEDGGQSIKHVEFNEAWVMEGDP